MYVIAEVDAVTVSRLGGHCGAFGGFCVCSPFRADRDAFLAPRRCDALGGSPPDLSRCDRLLIGCSYRLGMLREQLNLCP